MMILQSTFDKILMISMQTLMINNFFVLFSETLMFQYFVPDDSLMMPWRDIVETLIISKETLSIFFVSVVVTSESLIFHCWFIDDWLMTLCGNIVVTAKISMETLLILNFFDLISETLMFHCCFVDDLLMITWRKSDESASISM